MENKIISKVCFKCGVEKPLTDYYAHKQMGDGHLNKCKQCAKSDVKKRSDVLSLDESWMEKERERGREKYKRLNYLDKYKYQNEKFKFRKSTAFKNIHSYLGLPPEIEAHHWNYNNGFEYDIIKLSKKDHKRCHVKMILDFEFLMYRAQDMELLDTREKHIEYINKFILNGSYNPF